MICLSKCRPLNNASTETNRRIPPSSFIAEQFAPEPTCSYLNNNLEQDHRAIKRRVNASQGFRSFDGAWRTLQGYEVLHMIRKGQVRWLPKGDVAGQVQFVNDMFGLQAA